MDEVEIKRALSKCVVYFKDGNRVYFYSRDGNRKNMALGIRRLEKMLMGKLNGTWHTAIIYENGPSGREIAKYHQGVKV